MRSRRLGLLVLSMSVVGFFTFSSSVFGQATPIKLNFTHHFPAPHSVHVLSNEWGKEIEKRTNGKVIVTVFAGATLAPADKAYDGVAKGIADVGMAVLAFTRGKFPLSEVLDLPLGAKDALTATKLADEYFTKFKPKEFDETKVMYFFGNGPSVVHSKKAINRYEDLKGVKFRCTGLAAKIVAAVGGAPVAMPVGEAYDALSRGVVDATLGTISSLEGWKWADVVKFTVEIPALSNPTTFLVAMNKTKWNSIPPDVQKIIEKVNEEWGEKMGKDWDAIDKAGREYGLKRGVKISSFPKEEDEKVAKAVRPLLDDYVANMKKKGLPGEEALKFCIERLKQL